MAQRGKHNITRFLLLEKETKVHICFLFFEASTYHYDNEGWFKAITITNLVWKASAYHILKVCLSISDVFKSRSISWCSRPVGECLLYCV